MNWIVASRLGRDSLQYWGRLLEGLANNTGPLEVLTAYPFSLNEGSPLRASHRIRSFKKFIDIGRNGFFVFLPMPGFLRHFSNGDRVIINEFSLANLYIVIFKIITRKQLFLLLLIENRPRKESYLRRHIRKFIAVNVDRVLVNNTDGRDYAASLGSRSIFLGPYLTSEMQFVSRSAVRGRRLRILFVGSFIERKGVDLLLSALNALNRETLNSIEVELVGSGPLERDISQEVKKLNLENIVSIGRYPYESMSDVYGKCDLFVLPTRYDYRSLSYIEAALSGALCLGSIFDGSALELSNDHSVGALCDPNNLEEFTSILFDSIKKLKEENYTNESSRELRKVYSVKRCVDKFQMSLGI